MNKTKIEWCDYTWNVVTGCLNNCQYCYAKKIYHRFNRSFEPQFHPERLYDPMKLKHPAKIFACSVSDLWGKGVEPYWRIKVFDVIRSCTRHTFIILTKQPHKINFDEVPEKNVWLGVTVTGQEDIYRVIHLGKFKGIRFVSFEPLLYPITFNNTALDGIDWVIIGGKTGHRPFIPPKEWVDKIIAEARGRSILLFLKDNLHYHQVIQEFPRR